MPEELLRVPTGDRDAKLIAEGVVSRAPGALTIFISHPSECLTDHLPHGDGLVAYEFISRLAARGHTVHVAAHHVEIRGPLPPNLIIHCYPLRLPSLSLAPLESMVRIRSVFRRISRLRPPDIVHQLNPVEAGLSALLSRAGVPLILGPYIPAWPGLSLLPRRWTMRQAIRWAAAALVGLADAVQTRRAAALILSTPAALDRVRALGATGHAVCVLPYGVDTRRFSPVPERPLGPSGPPRILFLANLFRRKGIYTLIEAFERVNRVFPACELCIAGDGPERRGIEEAAAAMATQARIVLMGPVERTGVPDVMRACTVYCLPSDGEPFGVSVLEAMACGKPVVVTDAGGLRHLVDPLGGRRVPVRDPVGLADALIGILRSPELQAAMGRHNRALAVARYDWETVIDRLEQVYLSALAEACRSGNRHHGSIPGVLRDPEVIPSPVEHADAGPRKAARR